MRIEIRYQAVIGDSKIPPGTYHVSVRRESRQFILAGGGKDYVIPCVRRPGKAKVRKTDVQFYCSGGPNWTILVKTPPQGEWAAQLRYDQQKR